MSDASFYFSWPAGPPLRNRYAMLANAYVRPFVVGRTSVIRLWNDL